MRAAALSAFLPDVQWLIARSDDADDALILAAKGGHNAESHNHNDGGSFIVHYRQEALIGELGAPTYTRQFFSGERYRNLAARSLGHSVPFVNGCEQLPGRERSARVLAQGDGSLSLDLTGFYPAEAKLAELRRDIALRLDSTAGDGHITLSDRTVFTEDGATLALPLVTRDCAAEVVGPGHARITGERGRLDITWDPAQAACRAEEVPTEDPKFRDAAGRTCVRRLWFDIAVSGRETRLDLRLVPSSLPA